MLSNALHYTVNPLLGRVAPPPIAEARGWIKGRDFPADKPLIDVCQAVPGYPPPTAMTDHLASVIGEPETSRYTDIEGLPALREALAADIQRIYGGKVTADNVLITAGCNQAYCLTTLSLAKAGEEIILPLPYYFNYQMWLDMQGIRARHVAFRPDNGGVPDLDEIASAIGPSTRALLIISPNNPTGAVYSPEVLRGFYRLAKSRGIALILDETYRDFMPHDEAPHDLFQDPDWQGTLIHLYSFSKVFCLTGYRVGALVGAPTLVENVAKAMDTVAICAPHIGQLAAIRGLDALGDWRRSNTLLMRERLTALRSALSRTDLGYELISAGAYFAYVRHPYRGQSAADVARRLVDRQNLLALPGTMFGPNQEDYLRVAFANVEKNWMSQIAARLAADAAS
jgi:aspartate/methionine/tyrosine aminotransferase